MPEKMVLPFCHYCSNGTLDGGCLYNRQAECAITEKDIREVAAKINRIVELHGAYEKGKRKASV